MEQDLFSQHSEIAILSLILKNPNLVEKAGYLRPDMLSSLPNKNIYDAIITIKREGLVPEYSLIVTYLESRNLLQDCGGESYIQWLISQNFDGSNFEEFVNQVINSYKTKELFIISTQLATMARGTESIDEKISWIRDRINDLSAGKIESTSDIFTASNRMLEILTDKMNNPHKVTIDTGFEDLNLVTGGYWPGDLWVVAGRPGMGKSSFLCNSVFSEPSLIFSLEMPQETVAQRLVSIKSGIPIFNMRIGNVDSEGMKKIRETIDEIKNLPIYIDTSYNIDIGKIVSTIRQHRQEKGIKVVHLDYIQLLVERSINATHDIGKVSRDLKLLAHDLGITIVMYSQLNRSVESRDDKRPILSDLRQSGNLEEDPDVALFLYRDVLYNKDTKNKKQMEFIIRKQRNGPIGTVFMEFDDATKRIIGVK